MKKRCNMCGREIEQKQEEYLYVHKEWGYFSGEDRKTYHFQICESCFKKMINQFEIPAEVYEQTELI